MASASGRILIVDDDNALLAVMQQYLSRLGYSVDICPGGAEAWALLEANPALYVGALLDINLPGMRGDELARRILHANASIRLIVASGGPQVSNLEDGGTPGRITYLPKPFAPQQLAEALSTLL